MSLKSSSASAAALALSAALSLAPVPAEGQASNRNTISVNSGNMRVPQSAQREQRVKDAAEIRGVISRGAELTPDQVHKYNNLVTIQRADSEPVLRFYIHAISSDIENEIGIGVISASQEQRDKLASAAADAALKWNMAERNAVKGHDGEYKLIDSVYVMNTGTGQETFRDGKPILDVTQKKIEMSGPAAEGAVIVFHKGVMISLDNQRRPMKFEPKVVLNAQGTPQKDAKGRLMYAFSRDDLKELFRTLVFAEKVFMDFARQNPEFLKQRQAQRLSDASTVSSPENLAIS
jgi:hypothetical protein